MPANTVITQAPSPTSVTVVEQDTVVQVTGTQVTTISSVTSPTPTTVTLVQSGPQGPPGTTIVRTVHTFAISGSIAVAIGDTNFLPPFFFSKVVGQVSVIKKVRYRINSGTNATMKLQVNGSDASGYTGMVATTVPAETTGSVALNENDLISLVVTAISSAPTNLTATIVIEHSF